MTTNQRPAEPTGCVQLQSRVEAPAWCGVELMQRHLEALSSMTAAFLVFDVFVSPPGVLISLLIDDWQLIS